MNAEHERPVDLRAVDLTVDARESPAAALGTDPDPRFTFANERTFLAWSRTGLGLIGGGLAVAGLTRGAQSIAAIVVMAFGVFLALGSYRRWQRVEQALRLGDPLPASSLPRDLAYGVVVAGVGAAVIAVLR